MSQTRKVGEPDWEWVLRSLREPLSPNESLVDPVMARLQTQSVEVSVRPNRVFRGHSFWAGWVPVTLSCSLLGMVGVVLSWVVLLGSPALTMAEVIQAVSMQRWAHLEFDDNLEVWVSMENGRYLWKRPDGSCFHRDPVHQTEERYDPAIRRITIHQPEAWLLGVKRNGKIIPLEVDALQFPEIEQQVPGSQRIDGDNGFSLKWQYSIEKQQTLRLGRFDEYRGDALGDFHHTRTLWVDLRTKLPIRVKERMNGADREKTGKEYREGIYSFRETGPTTLAQLGVPENTPIQRVLSEGVTLDQLPLEMQKALKGAAASIERFPRHLRILELEGGGAEPALLVGEPNLCRQSLEGSPSPSNECR